MEEFLPTAGFEPMIPRQVCAMHDNSKEEKGRLTMLVLKLAVWWGHPDMVSIFNDWKPNLAIKAIDTTLSHSMDLSVHLKAIVISLASLTYLINIKFYLTSSMQRQRFIKATILPCISKC